MRCSAARLPWHKAPSGLLSRPQVMDSSMPLIGEHVEEDKQLMADLVISKMSQLLMPGGTVPSPLRPWVREHIVMRDAWPSGRGCPDPEEMHPGRNRPGEKEMGCGWGWAWGRVCTPAPDLDIWEALRGPPSLCHPREKNVVSTGL